MSRTRTNVEPPDELHDWRERALRATLIATLGVGAISLFLTLRQALHAPHQRPTGLFFLVTYLSLVLLLTLRCLDYRLRAWGLLLAGYATGGMALARGGLAGSGRAYLLMLPVVAVALMGVRSGMAAALLSLLTYGGFALAAGQGWLQPWLVHPESLPPPSVWFYEGATFVMLLAVTTLLVGLLVREQALALARVERARAELAAAHSRLLAAREEERKRLARELHDLVLQELFLLIQRLDWFKRVTGEEANEELARVREEMVRLVREVRRICTALRPPGLDNAGLARTIRCRAEAFAARRREAGSPLVLRLDLNEGRLPEDVGIALFRVFQEGLSNVERHAQASKVEVGLTFTPDRILLTIRDDGCGFAASSHLDDGSIALTTGLAQEGCLGLLGARERMEALGGGLKVVSRPGAGTLLRAWAPGERLRARRGENE